MAENPSTEANRDGTSELFPADAPLPPFDMATPEYRDNLGETLDAYRSRCPFGHSDRHGGFYYALKSKDIGQVIRNAETFVSSRGLVTPRQPVPDTMIPINIDPPELFEWRSILNPIFTPKLMEAERPRLLKETYELFDAAAAKGSVDMVNDVAQPLSGTTTLRLIGLDPDDWHEYAVPYHKLAFGTIPREETAPLMRAMEERLREDMRERIGTPRAAGLIKYLSEEAMFNDRAITFDEIYNIILILLGGGLDTTQALVGTATAFLGQNPDRQQELLDHPERMAGAIEEFLRVWPPTQNLTREAVKDAEVGGCPIKPGDRISMSFVAANHDPEDFENPRELDFTREPNRHFSFGMGPHRCLGSHLARVEIRVCLEVLLNRAPGFRVDLSKLQLARDISIFYGYESVPIILG